jgi:hypothetical protein
MRLVCPSALSGRAEQFVDIERKYVGKLVEPVSSTDEGPCHGHEAFVLKRAPNFPTPSDIDMLDREWMSI